MFAVVKVVVALTMVAIDFVKVVLVTFLVMFLVVVVDRGWQGWGGAECTD